MERTNYKLHNPPVYNPAVPALRNGDPLEADAVKGEVAINDILERVINNTHAVHETAEGLTGLFEPPVWHNLVLQNGASWPGSGVSRLSACRVGNIVFIRGNVVLNNTEQFSFAVLPQTLWPASYEVSIATPGLISAGSQRILFIRSDTGVITALSGTQNAVWISISYIGA